MRFAWVGSHWEGLAAFEALLDAGAPIVATVTLTADAAARRSGIADYASLCRRFDVPLHRVSDINAPPSVALLLSLDLDVLFVIGWSQILRPDALKSARRGVIGAHASLLPADRGSAPINWALIHGRRTTGNSLLWLAEGVDSGDIIDQIPICITPYDTCATLYGQVADTNRNMLLRLLPRLLAGERPGRPQPTATEPPLPRRRAADGLIDWAAPSGTVYDFVRALTRPYPGAFSHLDGGRWTVWDAAWVALSDAPLGAPGQCLGPAVSPTADACGQAVACGRGALVLLEVEDADGRVLRGRDLAAQHWAGRRWNGA
jgi:methionyl-tRNA formyltransferase